jgi:diacylglycerol kinase (ATP)
LTETVFVVNPASGNGAAGRRWPQVAERAAAYGLDGDALLTEGPGDATDLAARAAAGGARLVVVVGGDGTLNETVNGLVRSERNDIEVALIPSGTGDDFSRSFRIPSDIDRALEIAAGATSRTLDVGHARFVDHEGVETERYFVNFAGAGISGAIARRGAETSRRLGARLAYFWATIAVFTRWKSVEMTVLADDERREGRMHEVFVANGGYAAGGMWIAPQADTGDALLETVLIGDFTKPEFAITFPKIYRGKHVGHPKIEILRARQVTVEAEKPLPVVLDGEQPGTTPARFEIVPGALRLRVPAD